MSSPYFTNINQLTEFYYGPQNVQKADAPVLSSTTGVFNAVFGAVAFNQLNQEGNAFALLPKMPWEKSGWRAITADAGSTADGGLAENATLPDSIKPTFAEITATVKQVSHVFEVSHVQQGLVQTGDDALGDMELLRGYFATKHSKAINEQLCVDGNTLAGVNFESLDRVTASTAYATALSWTTGDEDIYGIDRSANAWADATVDHNSGVDRFLTENLIRDTLATVENKGGRTNILLTGNDTKWKIIGLYNNQVRYAGVIKEGKASIGINGVNTEEGITAGVRVKTVFDIPLFTSQAVPKDTISRIYLLDTTINDETGVPRLFISLLYPTLFFESGMAAGGMQDPFAINKLGTKGMYYTAGELICTFLAAQGSIRDLK